MCTRSSCPREIVPATDGSAQFFYVKSEQSVIALIALAADAAVLERIVDADCFEEPLHVLAGADPVKLGPPTISDAEVG